MAYIFAPADTPHGARGNVHRLAGIAPFEEKTILTLNTFVDENQTLVLWQDQYEVPNGLSYPEGIMEWLVSPAGFFPQGKIVNELDQIEIIKANRLASLNSHRNVLITNGYTVTGIGRFDTDDASIKNLMLKHQTALAAKQAGEIWSTPWRLADNSVAELSADDVITVVAAIDAFISAAYARSWELKDLIVAADEEALKTLYMNEGWPLDETENVTE